MSDLKEKIAAIKEKYTLASQGDKLYPIFKLRLEGLKDVNPQYFKKNETEMVKSTLAAQDMIEQGASFDDSGERITEEMDTACAKYQLDNGADINPYLLTDMVGAFLQDVEDGTYGRDGALSALEKARTSKLMAIPHNADRNGKASDALNVFGLEDSTDRISKAKAALNKNKSDNLTLENSADSLFPIFRLRLKCLKEVDANYAEIENNLVRSSLAVQEWYKEDPTLKADSDKENNLNRKYGVTDNRDAVDLLRFALRFDLRNQIVNSEGAVINPELIHSSSILNTPYVDDDMENAPIKAEKTLKNIKSADVNSLEGSRLK